MTCCALAAAALPLTGAAALNVPVASRIVAFVQPPPSGVVPAAIVYQPGSAASEEEAAQIERSIGRGLSAGRAVIRATRVASNDLGGLAGKRLAFVTVGIRNQGEVAAAAARHSVLTITSDLGCVQAGRCMVAVSGPQSQITVKKEAVRSANIRLGSAFLMLVKEL